MGTSFSQQSTAAAPHASRGQERAPAEEKTRPTREFAFVPSRASRRGRGLSLFLCLAAILSTGHRRGRAKHRYIADALGRCTGAMAHMTGTAETFVGNEGPALPPRLRGLQHCCSVPVTKPLQIETPLQRSLKASRPRLFHHQAKGNLTKRFFSQKANTWLLSDSPVEISPAAGTKVPFTSYFRFLL